MLLWILIAALTVICCAVLIYAARTRPVNDAHPIAAAAERGHQRSLLGEIDDDLAAGRISPADATAAKAELAREVIRTERETPAAIPDAPTLSRLPMAAALVAGVLGVAVYSTIGSPQLPSAPLAGRETPQQTQINLDDAVAQVEAQLAKTPDDVRGWRVLAPVYLQAGRYDDAVHAFRRILELAPPTADAQTDLAEALLLANDGAPVPEVTQLLEAAQALEPGHQRSAFYLAGEAMQAGDFDTAIAHWQALIDTAKGDESWLPIAQRGLEMAKAGTNTPPAATGDEGSQQQMIRSMVEGLDARLMSDGGTLEEWTQLIRSRLVLGERAKAQAAYDAARMAYPDATERAGLDTFADENGLTEN